MKDKLLSILNDEHKEVVAQKHTLTQADYYDPVVIDKGKIASLLSSDDVVVVASSDVRYSISTPKDKVNLYDRSGKVVKTVQKTVYTIDVLS